MAGSVVRVGLLGAGYIAEWHLKALRQVPGVEVRAVCDSGPGRAASFAAAHGLPEHFASLDDMLAGSAVEAVHVLLPPQAHADAAVTILESGRHALIEKPLAVTVEQCERVRLAAEKAGKKAGVGHNFLFAPAYEELADDVKSGRIGPLRDLEIRWHKELGQLRGGPFSGWLFRDGGNPVLEVGPHSFAHLIDLVGEPSAMRAEADDFVILPTGRSVPRRWRITGTAGRCDFSISIDLSSAFAEQSVHARGEVGSATADLDAGTYVCRRNAPTSLDFDRWGRTRAEAKALLSQGRRKVWRYVLSKAKLSKQGNDFGTSIARSLRAFYAGLAAPALDRRLTVESAAATVRLCHRAIASAGLTPADVPASLTRTPASPATVLVLGGTGFIGQALVRQLVEAGHSVRMLARDPLALPTKLHNLELEIVKGDTADADSVSRAMEGVSTVYHLARPTVKTWAEYLAQEVEPTRRVAEACLAAGVKRFIYTGTIDSYDAGRPGSLITEATPLDPGIAKRNLYARAKAESEKLLKEMQRDKGLPLVIARPGIVLGEGSSPFHWGVGMWFGLGAVRLWGRATHPMPVVLVEDCAQALVKALDAPDLVGKELLLVGPPLISGREYVRELARASKIDIQARPTSPVRFYLGDMAKWAVKVLVRHPNRRRPSYHDWRSRTQRATFDSGATAELLKWRPTLDRERLVEEGIARPARRWLNVPDEEAA